MSHSKMARDLPLIVDIKRHSLEDGPGIRSVVFFKGCPLRCTFCQNPESQEPKPELAFSAGDCIHCAYCREACPEGAIEYEAPGRIVRDRCIRCGKCAAVCPGRGLRLIGSYYPVADLLYLVLRDRAFYRHSGGGVTLSGGEPALYPDYLMHFLKLLKREGIHTVLETSGYFDYEVFSRLVFPFLDMIYFDLKVIDPEDHARVTGKTNRLILDNLTRLIKEAPEKVLPRISLIPGITATRKNLYASVAFLSGIGAHQVVLLPYNPLGLDMAVKLGRPRPNLSGRFMTSEEEREAGKMVERASCLPARHPD